MTGCMTRTAATVIVDSSALLAVILNEADEPRFAAAMIDAPALRMSAANWVEAAIVVDSQESGGEVVSRIWSTPCG